MSLALKFFLQDVVPLLSNVQFVADVSQDISDLVELIEGRKREQFVD